MNADLNQDDFCFETKAIRTQTPKSQNNEHSAPIYLTSSFVFDTAEDMRAVFAEEVQKHSYSRYTNPNQDELVNKIAQMEKAEAGFAFSTGMAGVYCSLFPLLVPGDHIVSCSNIFGSTTSLFTNLFPQWGVNTNYFDINDSQTRIESLIKPNTKILFAESPTNPGVDILDLELLGEIAKKHNLIFIIDNTFATPYLQNPIDFGANLVIHSTTKLIDGQGRVCGGVVVGDKPLIDKIYLFARTIGTALSPFNAWVLSKSLETLAVRVDRHCQNAVQIANFLEQHPSIDFVKYPFLPSHPQYQIAKKQMKQGGNIIAFGIKGGLQAGRDFLDKLQICSRSANLGDTRTIVTHPASTTHSKIPVKDRLKAGITDNLIRISIGLENPADIIADLQQALDTTK
ncbi:trans-sulfuration enzyme family protein [Myroides sp. LJL110]